MKKREMGKKAAAVLLTAVLAGCLWGCSNSSLEPGKTAATAESDVKAQEGQEGPQEPAADGAGTAEMDAAGSAKPDAAGNAKADGTGTAEAGETGKTEDVTVILDYVANTNHTGMYVALDQGYYAEEGLNVNIIEPTEGATATLIAVGKGDFGISYQEDVTIALTSENPLPIKAVATIIQHNTSGFATYADKDIKSPKDFEGKTYAGWGGPGEEAVLKAVMAKDGADFSKLSMVISDGSGFEALKHNVDVMWFFEAWDNVKCRMNDFPINYMEVRQLDERLDYYTPVIIANNKTLADNPEMVKKFLKATEKGYRYAIENPGESAAILQKYAPDYSLEMLTMSQEYLADKYMEDTAVWGVMKDEVWDRYTDFMVEYGVIKEAIPAAECYTNEFLPE